MSEKLQTTNYKPDRHKFTDETAACSLAVHNYLTLSKLLS